MPADARVAIVQQAVLQYRTSFYEQLRARLAAAGVELRLVHSNPRETRYRDAVDLPWAHRVPPRWIELRGRRLLWQPARELLRDADLVVVEQASKHLLNYVLAGEQLLGRRRLAFWGHGRDFATSAGGPGEAVKRLLTRHVHWWFAYTELSASVVASTGFPRERITVVQNALDTRTIATTVDACTPADVARLRAELGLPDGPVALYLGGLVASKQLGFVRAAVDAVRERTGDLRFLVVGAGEGAEAARMEAWAEGRPWVRLLGPRFDAEKARLLALADVLLVPAWAGLVVVDAFAGGVPLVVSASQRHPPERSYLRDGVNGLVVDDGGDPGRYADAVVSLLRDPDRRAALASGARRERSRYTVEAMVGRFADGVLAALGAR